MAKTLKNIVERRLADKSFIEGLVNEPIEDFSVSGNSEGGWMGTIKPIVIKTKSGITHRIIYKGAPVPNEDFKLFSFFVHFRLIERENLFYKIIAPEMEKLCNGPLPIAKMYDCLTNEKTGFLILENLRPLGYTMPEKYPGLNYDETKMILQQLGAFHAKGFHYIREGNHDTTKTDLSLFQMHFFQAKDEPTNPHWLNYSIISRDTINIIKDRISANLADKMDTLCSRTIENIAIPWKLSKEGKYFSVVCHGDLWTNNTMFKYSQETKKPLDVKFIDFQHCHIGSIYEDLYYFIFTSTSPEMRKEHLLSTILDIYYDAFIQELQRIGTEHPKYFTREKFNQEFFENAVSALVFTVFAISFHLGEFPQQQEQDDSTDINIEDEDDERQLIPVVDVFEGYKTFCPIAFKNSERAMKRLVDVIHEFSEMNIV